MANAVNVTILYCQLCNFRHLALKIADALLDKYGPDAYRFSVTLRPGDEGVFEVFVNENQIFSKKDAGRLPESREIINLVKI